MDKALIQIEDINQYAAAQISESSINGSNTKADHIVLAAQRKHIMPAISASVYRLLFTEQSNRITELLRGGEMQDRQGDTVFYFGIVPALAIYSEAEYIKRNDLRYTATGNKRKQDNKSDYDSTLIEKVYKGRIDEANNYLMQCIWYLYQGSQYDWPEFQLCNSIQPLRSNAISVVGAKESYLEPDVNNVPFGRGRGELGDNGRIINYYGIS